MKRIVWIDNAKMILILFVVVGHTPYLSLVEHNVIYSFHMPAFFMISGFLYKKKSIIWSFLSFLIPVLCFSLMRIAFLLSFDKDFDFSCYDVYPHRFDRGQELMGGYWYLYVLLIIQLVMNFIDKINHNIYKYLAIIFFAVTLCIDEFSILTGRAFVMHRLFSCFPFFAVGILLKEKHFEPTSSWRVVVLTLWVGVILALINGSTALRSLEFGYSYLLFFVIAVTETYVLVNCCKSLPENSFSRYISIGTLCVLGLHSSLIEFFDSLDLFPGMFFSHLVPIIILIICLPIIVILNRFCPICLGKRSATLEKLLQNIKMV